MAKSKHYYIRKSHRWLGVFLGIQFLMWTIGGLYFSWNNIDEVHGDPQKRDLPMFSTSLALVSPSTVIDQLNRSSQIDSILSIQLIRILDKNVYQIKGLRIDHRSNSHHQHLKVFLADAETGVLRNPLTKEEAIEVAKRQFNGKGLLKSVEYITSTDQHHEYRENPLPAYAVTFDHPTHTTVYVASELGTVQKFRNQKWRVFDFLWMLHTMDYESRDNIGNMVLRIFSVLGLLTILSGFALFFVSMKWRKR